MKAIRTAFIHSDEVEQYHYPESCPFKTERAGRTREILSSMDFYTGANRREVAPRKATVDEAAVFHTPDYLSTLERVSGGDLRPEDLFLGLGREETPVFTGLYDYALLACGASLTAAELILEGSVDVVFNPSGGFHHATAESAGGFCYLNDVVLACGKLADAGKRVLCLDLDAHHGNGTQEAFYSSSKVFTVSMHESGKTLYPWGGFEDEIGEGDGEGYNMNVPLPPRTDDQAFYAAFRRLIPPLISGYRPDVVVLEVGMDILSVDPLTHLSMTNNVIADALPLLQQFEIPILVVGGGGYSPEDTARGWALAWCVLNHIQMEEDMYMGLGGVFLGSSEWNAGLRDPHIYLQGTEKEAVRHQLGETVETLEKTVLARHAGG